MYIKNAMNMKKKIPFVKNTANILFDVSFLGRGDGGSSANAHVTYSKIAMNHEFLDFIFYIIYT